MSKNKGEIVAFNAGEFGDEALARTDLQNYARGAETMENIFPHIQGGMSKMPGTIYVAATPSNGAAEFRPFIFSESVKFGLEFSDTKMRIVVDGGLLQLEGAAASVGSWSDESAATPSGGGDAPSGGTGELFTPETYWVGDVYGVYA
jgi:hypothetical protein